MRPSESLSRHSSLRSKQKGNFYANAPLSDIYKNGLGVQKDEKLAKKLLLETKDIDPIAAYKLSFYYLDTGEVDDAIELLQKAAKNNVKLALLKLSDLYKNAEYIRRDMEMSKAWQEEYDEMQTDFATKIYGK